MSSKESHKDIKQSNKKSKTQRFVFLEKNNHYQVNATSQENPDILKNKNNRFTLKFGYPNIVISPFNSYNFNELRIQKNEILKAQESKKTLNTPNSNRRIKFSPNVITTNFNSLIITLKL